MRKFIIHLTIPCILLFSILSTVTAQEIKAKKYDNPQWKTVSFLKFKPGKGDRAREIIRNYYEKAAQKAAIASPIMALDLVTGEWDLMVVWEMKGGIAEMDWEVTPDNVKWMAALNEIAGGGDKAKAILDEFSGLIDRENTTLGKTMALK